MHLYVCFQAESDSYDSETGGPPGLLPAGQVDDSELSEVSMVGGQSGDDAKCLAVCHSLNVCCGTLGLTHNGNTVTIISLCSTYRSQFVEHVKRYTCTCVLATGGQWNNK